MDRDIETYRDYLKKDEWSSSDFTHKRNNNMRKAEKIKFNNVPENFKNIVKAYMYSSLNTKTFSTCKANLRNIIPFLNYINEINPNETDFKFIEAEHIASFLNYLEDKNKEYQTKNIKIITAVRCMIKTLQIKYSEYVTDIDVEFILKGSSRRFYKANDKVDIKYIPEAVIYQFDEKINNMKNNTDLIISKILRCTGWRCNEVFRLKYDTSIVSDEDKYYIVLEQVSKTRVLDKHVPVAKDLAIEMKKLADTVKSISNKDNNPNRYLFIHTHGKNKGKRIGAEAFINRLNKWSKANEIRDNTGEIYKFRFHMFRHTRGYELINTGIEIETIKLLLSHRSEDMTLEYTSINRSSMREEYKRICGDVFEEAEGFECNVSMVVDILAFMENMKTTNKNLGYCIKPKSIKCKLESNKCKECKSLKNNL